MFVKTPRIDLDQRRLSDFLQYPASLGDAEMNYRAIMVHLAPGAANEHTVGIARDLASRTDSSVIGIAAADVSPPTYFMDGREAQSLLEQMRVDVQVGLSELREIFEKHMRGAEVRAEWRSNLCRPLDYLCDQSRAADIIVVPAIRSVFTDPFATASLDRLLVAAGRPVLVVPPSVKFLDLRHVVVAWKDTREARRAISDALPLLRLAKEVSIVEVPERESGTTVAPGRLDDLRRWLGHHGVTATCVTLGAGTDPSTGLKQFASDAGASLIVAGAYGHSRLQEFIWGGVTDDLLRTSKISLLLSN